MKTLIPVDSRDRNPSISAHYNEAISYDYLVLVNGCYGRGTFSFINNKWMVIEQFKVPIAPDVDKSEIDLHRQTNWSPDKVIWFEEK